VTNKPFKWRKWNNILHRDIGYLVFGMTLIYALSGIALNHIKDWNPSYDVSHHQVVWEGELPGHDVSKETTLAFLESIGESRKNYKKHYYPTPNELKIFLRDGNIMLNVHTGKGMLERLKRRPIFYEVNYLHYNPARLWMWFSDLFCVALILVSITGLFVLKGRKGITGRGAWLTGIGVVIPLVFLLMYV